MDGKWNNEFRKVNLIKEIKLRRWLKASFYDIAYKNNFKYGIVVWKDILNKLLTNVV